MEPDLNEDFIPASGPGMLKTLFPFLPGIIIFIFFPHPAKALDKTTEVWLDLNLRGLCWDGSGALSVLSLHRCCL